MREFLFLLLAAAVIGGGGWALLERLKAQDALIKDLRARVETGDRLAQSEDRATTEVIERQTVILRERDRAKDEITQAVGSSAVVPAPVWSAARIAIERMRQQAHPGPADRNAGLAS
jgi:hypothetical protein